MGPFLTGWPSTSLVRSWNPGTSWWRCAAIAQVLRHTHSSNRRLRLVANWLMWRLNGGHKAYTWTWLRAHLEEPAR